MRKRQYNILKIQLVMLILRFIKNQINL